MTTQENATQINNLGWAYGRASGSDARSFGIDCEPQRGASMADVLANFPPVRATTQDIGGPLLSLGYHPADGWFLVRRVCLPELGYERTVEVLQASPAATAAELWALRDERWADAGAVVAADHQQPMVYVEPFVNRWAADLLCRLAAGHKVTTTGLNATQTAATYSEVLDILPRQILEQHLWCTAHVDPSREAGVVSGLALTTNHTAIQDKSAWIRMWDRKNQKLVDGVDHLSAKWLLDGSNARHSAMRDWCWFTMAEDQTGADYLQQVLKLAQAVRPLTYSEVDQLTFRGARSADDQVYLTKRLRFMLSHQARLVDLVDVSAQGEFLRRLSMATDTELVTLVVEHIFPQAPLCQVVPAVVGTWAATPKGSHKVTQYLRTEPRIVSALAKGFVAEAADLVDDRTRAWFSTLGYPLR